VWGKCGVLFCLEWGSWGEGVRQKAQQWSSHGKWGLFGRVSCVVVCVEGGGQEGEPPVQRNTRVQQWSWERGAQQFGKQQQRAAVGSN
jgi:hypothetical protein